MGILRRVCVRFAVKSAVFFKLKTKSHLKKMTHLARRELLAVFTNRSCRGFSVHLLQQYLGKLTGATKIKRFNNSSLKECEWLI
tara:strand:- start:10492 stop:10743 length:252 start_codon:yes stop_codon:yes gene_type:complete